MRRVLATVCCAAGLATALPAAARAAGGPMLPIQGGAGIADGAAHIVPVRLGHRTRLERRRADGTVRRSTTLDGAWGIPEVSVDGASTGLASRAHRLVLAAVSRAYPPRRSRLLVVDSRRLTVRDHVTLGGFYTVDAVSPSGRWLYLLHYTAPSALRYEVRAYDLLRHRLLARPVVDPREPDEKMLGVPLARSLSADARWAYTLYQRPQGAPFIHALDTVRRRAVCVDLDGLGNPDLSGTGIVVADGGRTLRVAGDGVSWATVDTRTWHVTPLPPARQLAPGPAPSPAPHRPAATPDAGALWWPAPVAALLALAAVTGLAVRRREPA